MKEKEEQVTVDAVATRTIVTPNLARLTIIIKYEAVIYSTHYYSFTITPEV